MIPDAVQALEELIAAVKGVEAPTRHSLYVDWHELYNSETGDEEWIAWPLFPARRQCVVYAPAKAGKSLIVLDVVASIASGKPILGQPNQAGRRHVLYLDYEMTGADLLERLVEMGYEPEDLTHLHYALLPIIPALNTPDGAKVVREMAAECNAELIVVDTLSRAVEGDINAPNTVTDFYSWTGIALKADGRALVRLDHEGKDASKGMLGSSMKAADVDVVWHLKRTDDGLLLTRKWTRIMWGEDEVAVKVEREPLRHVIAPRGYIAGTSEARRDLEALGVPSDASTRHAQKALKDAGKAHRRVAIVDACRARREALGLEALIGGRPPITGSEPVSGGSHGNQFGNHPAETLSPAGTGSGTTGNHPPRQQGVVGSLYRGNHTPEPDSEPVSDLVSELFGDED